MPVSYRFFSAVLLLLYVAMPCQAEHSNGYYENGRQGFYWYEKQVVVEEGMQEAFKQPPADGLTYNQLWRVHPAKFAKLLTNRRDLAIQTPSKENMYRYLQIQDVAKRKSVAFAGVMGMVSQNHPEFRGRNINTMPNAASTAYYREKTERMDTVFNTSKDDFALIVFESQGCGYCEAQRPIVEAFEADTQWSVKYLDIHEHTDLAQKYGIDMTPSIMLLGRSDRKMVHISTGVVSMAELKSNIARAVRHLSGETAPEQWFNAPGVTDPLKLMKKGRRHP